MQQFEADGVGEEAEVRDANEAAREQMQQEAPQELVCRQAHQLLLVAMSGVAPTERDVAIGKVDQSVVGDRDTMGVSTEIAQDMLGASEGALGVHDPVVAEQCSQPCGEAPRISKMQEAVVKPQRSVVECRL